MHLHKWFSFVMDGRVEGRAMERQYNETDAKMEVSGFEDGRRLAPSLHY